MSASPSPPMLHPAAVCAARHRLTVFASSGPSSPPKVLQLAVADDAQQPDAPFARYFARRVAALSEGSVKVRLVWDAAGQSSPGYELGIARRVRDGDFELGWMGSRACGRMGVKSFLAWQDGVTVRNGRCAARLRTASD